MKDRQIWWTRSSFKVQQKWARSYCRSFIFCMDYHCYNSLACFCVLYAFYIFEVLCTLNHNKFGAQWAAVMDLDHSFVGYDASHHATFLSCLCSRIKHFLFPLLCNWDKTARKLEKESLNLLIYFNKRKDSSLYNWIELTSLNFRKV